MGITNKVPSNVLAFAGGETNLGVYEAFGDYWNHYRSEMEGKKGLFYHQTRTVDGKLVEFSLAEKEAALNAAIKKEIIRKAGIADISQFPLETWAGHPVLRWASFAVVSAMIDMILPQTLIDSIGMYTELKTIGWGDTAAFDVKPRDLFVVSKVGRGKRQTELKKQYSGQVVLNPEPRQIAVTVSLYRVLTGQESLSDFTMKAVRSMETQMTYDAYAAFASAMGAIDNTASIGLRVAGYSQAEFVRLSQTVRAWNGGATPVAIGTQAALANVLPADANYRYDLSSEYVKLGYIRNFQNTDIMVLPQLADYTTPFGLKLADNRIWLVSPSTDKIIKAVLEGSTLAYADDMYANANLLQNASIQKSYAVGVATGSVGATIEI
jgi:hypothetical protein